MEGSSAPPMVVGLVSCGVVVNVMVKGVRSVLYFREDSHGTVTLAVIHIAKSAGVSMTAPTGAEA